MSTTQRRLVIETTGDLTSDVLDRDVATALLQRAGQRVMAWLAANGPDVAFRFFFFLLIVSGSWVLASATRRLSKRALVGSTQLVRDTVVSWVSRAILMAGVVVGLTQLGLELGPLLAGLGIAGFVIGFALQDSLANFAAGAMIVLYRPFDVGDVIEAGGVSGTVEEMSLVSTTISTFDNQLLFVPNNKIWGGVVRNASAKDIRRVDLEIPSSFDSDVDRLRSILTETATSHPKILDDPSPTVRLNDLEERRAIWIVRPWTRREDYWTVRWDVLEEIKRRFDAEAIRFSEAQPQRNVDD